MNNNIIVFETSRNLRAMAREALAGKWKIAAVATLVYLIAVIVPTTILNAFFGDELGYSGLSTLYSLIIIGPFAVGYSIFCLSIFRNQEVEVAQVFYGFERFFKAFALFFVMILFIVLWSFLLIIPGIIAAFRYSQAFLIMIDHPEYGILQCLSESKRLMVGNKFKLFSLEFSFIGWAILASIPTMVLGGIATFTHQSVLTIQIAENLGNIATIWLTPYMTVATVAFYEIANGNLRAGVIEGNATFVDDQYKSAETFVDLKKEENKTDQNDLL